MLNRRFLVPYSTGPNINWNTRDPFEDGNGISWYKLDNNVLDSGLGYHGTIVNQNGNAITFSSTTKKFGTHSLTATGSAFNGSYVTTTKPTYTYTTESFWVYLTAQHQDDTLVFSTDLFREGSNYAYLFDSAGNTSTNYLIPTGQWVHCAMVDAGGTVKFYTNGIQRWTATRTSDFNRTSLVSFSHGSDGGRTFLDNIRIFNRVLSDDEISLLAGEE